MRTTTVLAIDQGTTNSKVLLVDAGGRVLSQGSKPLAPIKTPQVGWFEQDAEDLWQATMGAVADCLNGCDGVAVAGVAIANQRESVVAWRRSTGQPVSPVLGWQDGRTADFCRALSHDGADTIVHAKTGLTLDPMFSGAKLRWLLDHMSPVDDICLGTIDAYLVSRLTGRCVIEAGNASRTLLFGLQDLRWDDELLDMFGLPESVLPRIVASDGEFGVTDVPGLLRGVPVLAVLGDSHAALYQRQAALGDKQAVNEPSEMPAVKVTYGTGSSLMFPLPGLGPLPEPVSTTLAWLVSKPQYAHEGNIIATGAALAALAGMLSFRDVGVLLSVAGAWRRDQPAGAASLVSYVPAFSGLAAPHWDRQATGLVVGLGRDSGAGELAWAGCDAVAEQVCDVIDALHDAGDEIDSIDADGGASRDDGLMQLQADLAGLPVRVASVPEASALGVARLAWHKLDLGNDASWHAGAPMPSRTYRPRRSIGWRKTERSRWADAVRRSRGLAVNQSGRTW